MELKREALLLQRFQHPNIVTLYGEGSIVLNNDTVVYYVVIERLAETLNQRLTRSHSRNVKKNTEAAVPVLASLANALCYLHEADPSTIFVHRDVKPDNIGFTADGVLKIFDFGLSGTIPRPQFGKPQPSVQQSVLSIDQTDLVLVEASPVHATSEFAQFNLTGIKGSVRYMAPEVALGQVYDQSIDVYSFALVMWECVHGKKPYMGLDVDMHARVVCMSGGRPDIDNSVPANVAAVMRDCWNESARRRPSMGDAALTLQQMQAANEAAAAAAPPVQRRTFSFGMRGFGFSSRSSSSSSRGGSASSTPASSPRPT